MHELVSFEITLRELVITSLFEEDPPCLVCVCVCVCGRGGGGGGVNDETVSRILPTKLLLFVNAE